MAKKKGFLICPPSANMTIGNNVSWLVAHFQETRLLVCSDQGLLRAISRHHICQNIFITENHKLESSYQNHLVIKLISVSIGTLTIGLSVITIIYNHFLNTIF
jgi:hypothetical protein